ncbi:MAG TPA: CoA-transferase [Candidatus Methylomirabilis sp.]|nr:CoA-transferase [Candidatus Methylomirabilis sp.]
MTTDYTLEELMACAISRELRDGQLGFIGLGTGGRAFIYAVGVPSVAIELAHRRGIDFIAQYGVKLEPRIPEAPACFTDANLLAWPCRAMILVEDCLDMFRRGMMDWGFVSGAQIDPYGNLNAVCIGDQAHPKVRLVGPIAQTDHCAHAKHTMIIVPHDRRVFVPKVDFISGLGFGDGPGYRERYRHHGGGPAMVVTNLAILDFHPETKRMRVQSLHPGVTPQQVAANTGFALEFPDPLAVTPAPTAEEVGWIRNEIDPRGLWLQAKVR